VNATASSVTPRARMVIAKALAADHEVVVADTTQRGHATRLASDAAERGVDAVVVLGGDGTLNEAANGLAGSSTALAALPGGSTNVFARTIGLPNDPIEATGQLLTALEAGRRERVGLGSVNGRYFLFHLGVGFDATVVERVERRGRLKRRFGHGWFAWNALTAWLRHYDRSHPRFAVRLGGGRSIDDAYLALFLNTDPYTWFGPRPLSVAPGTGPADPLSIMVMRTLRLVPTLGMVGRALVGGGAVARSRWAEVEQAEEQADVEGYGPVPHQVDGEYLGVATALEVRHHPGILELVVPTAPPG
jgi:diacylglycerol kinase family enzyme